MKKIGILFLVLAVSFLGNCQYSLGVGYAGTHPLGDLLRNNYKDGNGIDIYFLSKGFPEYSRIQVQIGGDLNAFSTGERKISNVATSSGYNATYSLKNSHNGISFKTRFLTQENTFRYHADIDLGYRSFYTTEGLTFNKTDTNQPPYTSTVIKRNKTFFTGITAGILYRVNNWLSLDVYTRIDFGSSASWFDINSFSVKNNQPDYSSFQYKTTNTPLLWAGMSAVFHFKPRKLNRIENSPGQNPQPESEPSYPTPEPPVEPTPRGRVAR